MKPSLLVLASLLLLGGCVAPPRFVAENFEASPVGWSSLNKDGSGAPAAIPESSRLSVSEKVAAGAAVVHGRLIVQGTRTYCHGTSFDRFHGFCDLQAAGGMLDESAGIFIEETRLDADGAGRTYFYTLAVNGKGEWKSYRGFPDRPLGVSVWAQVPETDPTAPLRLGAACDGETISFSVNGKQVSSFNIGAVGGGIAAAGRGASAIRGPASAGDWKGTDGGRLRIGIFSAGLTAAVDAFIFGEDGPGEAFRPEERLRASPQEGKALLEEAAARAEAFRRKPTRAGLLAVIEAYTAAENAFLRGGDPIGAEVAAAQGAQVLGALEPAARLARSEDLLQLALRARTPSGGKGTGLLGRQGEAYAGRARAAGAAGRPAEALVFWLAAGALEKSPEADREAGALIRILDPPLAFVYSLKSLENLPKEFPRQGLFAAVRDIYGNLPESLEGEIRIEVTVQEATVDHAEEATKREVPLTVQQDPLPPPMRLELSRLEKSFPEDVRDAVARAKTQSIVDLTGRSRIVKLELDGKSLPVTPEDAQKLNKTSARLQELRRLSVQQKASAREFVSIEARLLTDSARLGISFRLLFGGQELAGEASAYEGTEQWSHPADTARKIPASAYSKAERDRLIAAVRDRVLGRLRTGIARQALLEKLSADETTRFILRFARSSREEGDREIAAWRLKSLFGLEGVTRERVLQALLRA